MTIERADEQFRAAVARLVPAIHAFNHGFSTMQADSDEALTSLVSQFDLIPSITILGGWHGRPWAEALRDELLGRSREGSGFDDAIARLDVLLRP